MFVSVRFCTRFHVPCPFPFDSALYYLNLISAPYLQLPDVKVRRGGGGERVFSMIRRCV